MALVKSIKKAVKQAVQNTAALPMASVGQAKTLLAVGKGLMAGQDASQLSDTLVNGYSDAWQQAGTDLSGGIIKNSTTRRLQETMKTQAEKEAEAARIAELDAIENKKSTLLGRNKGRGFSNTLLGAGEV